MARRNGTGWAVIVVVVVSVLVTGAALAGAALVRARSHTAAGPSTGATAAGLNSDNCRRPPCSVLATASVGGTTIQLVSDVGGTSGRLVIGATGSSQVVETTVTDLGVVLSPDSLQCVAGSVSACLVSGVHDQGLAGEVVVGRSGSWSAVGQKYLSDAGYLALVNVTPDPGPELVAVQHECTTDCSRAPVYAQVFGLASGELGCTRSTQLIRELPGYPTITPVAATLTRCP